MKELIKKLSEIQRNLNAPKNQFNSYGNFSYRSCEDILSAVKKFLDDDCILIVTDEVISIEGWHYIKATARFIHGDKEITATACAREQESRKGMDTAQCSGSASSYARKYALNGLFLIDDTKDPDTSEFKKEGQNKDHQQHNKFQKNTSCTKEDRTTIQLRSIISNYTEKFKNKEKIGKVCKDLGLEYISDIKNRDEVQKSQMLEFLKKNYQISGK